jgi:hypothetical protein
MSGGPPQHDMFDYKPKLVQLNGTPCPEEFTKGERSRSSRASPSSSARRTSSSSTARPVRG